MNKVVVNKVVVTQRIQPPVRTLLEPHCRLVINESESAWLRPYLIEESRDADALMVFMPDWIDDAFLRQCPNLKIVAGALKGYDNFDADACTRRGVWFTIVPDLLTEPTAELALALMLAVARNVREGDRQVRGKHFAGWRPLLYGSTVRGSTVGVIGFGQVGRAFVRLIGGFDCRRIYCDPSPASQEDERRLGVERVSLDDLLAASDFILPMLPLTPATLHLIGEQAIAKMKRGAYLVNVGRGSVVDEFAVADALVSDRLAGYAADVFEMEDWARKDRPERIPRWLVVNREQTLFTPHLGSAVAGVRLEIELAAARSVLQALDGQKPDGAVNEIA